MKTSIKIFKITFGLLFLALAICQLTGLHFDNAFADMLGLGLSSGGVLKATGLINVGTMTFNGKEVQSMAEAVMEKAYDNPQLTSLHTVIDGIVAKTQIAYLGRLGKITKKDGGCETSPTVHEIPTSEKFYIPEDCSFWVSLCAKNLAASFFIWGQKMGINRRDLTGTEASQFIMTRLEEALVEDALRNAWFSHKDAGNVDGSPVGVLTSGVDADFYNIIDGFWEQIYTIVATTPARRYTITENAAVSYTLQDTLASDRAYKVMKAMLEGCDKRLKGDPNKVIILTDSLVDNYITYLEAPAVNDAYARIQSADLPAWDTGLRFRGVPIYKFDLWDRTIRSDFDNGTTWYQPHRAVLTTVNNLHIATDKESAVKDVTQYYLPKEKTNNWEGLYKFDAKISEDYMIQVAY